MEHKILCCNCNALIDISCCYEEYICHEEEDTFAVVKCETCDTFNAVSYTMSVDFSSRKADPEEIADENLVNS